MDNTWRTPEWLLDMARAYFGGPIPFDAATAPDNPTRALRYVVPAAGPLFPGHEPPMFEGAAEPVGERILGDGLALDWPPAVWCNPPYGSHLRAWMQKFVEQSARGVEIVTLIPSSRSETDYMQAAIAACSHLCLIRKRVAFISSRDLKPVKGNTSGSLLVGFNTAPGRWSAAFSAAGLCLSPVTLGRTP